MKPFKVSWTWQDSLGKRSLGGSDLELSVIEAERRGWRENLARVPTPTSGSMEVVRLAPDRRRWEGPILLGLVLDQRKQGKRETKPHGCEWMKNATWLEEEEAVKVVKNGVDGT